MAVNKNLLNRILLNKEGYAPPSPMPGAPGTDPSMMDPTMMAAGAAAPGGPGMAPPPGGGAVGPAAMAGAMPPGGAMDPSMMGGAPPMDPGMVGGLPPEGMPSMPPGGEDPMAGMPIMLTAEDLQALVEQAAGAASGDDAEPEDTKDSGRTTNTELMDRVDTLENMLGQLLSHFNITPANAIPGMAAGSEGAEDSLAAMTAEPAIPETLSTPVPGEMPSPEMADMGMVPMELGPETELKQASEDKHQQLAAILRQMNDLR